MSQKLCTRVLNIDKFIYKSTRIKYWFLKIYFFGKIDGYFSLDMLNKFNLIEMAGIIIIAFTF